MLHADSPQNSRALTNIQPSTGQAPVYVVSGAPDAAPQPESPLWMSDLLRSARRHKWAVLALTIAGALAGYVRARIVPDSYSARASLEVQNFNENFLNLHDLSPTTPSGNYDSDIQTQAKILRSNTLSKRVQNKLRVSAPGSRQYSPEAITEVSKSLKVIPSERARILDISANSPNPTLAADFLNTLTTEFINIGLEGRLQAWQKTGDWLNLQLQDLKGRLETSERQMLGYAGNSGFLLTSGKTNLAEDRLRQIQQDLAHAQTDLIAKQSRWEMARKSPPETLPEVLDSPSLREYQSRLTEVRRQLAELSSQYTPAYYRVQRVQAQSASLEAAFAKERDNILGRISHEYEDAKRKTKLLEAAYQDQARQLSGQSAMATRFDMLRHDVDTNRLVYEAMLQKVKEAGLATALSATNIRVTDPAEAPAAPDRPGLPLNCAMGAFGGMALGLCFARVKRRSDTRIQEPGETGRLLEVPELGVIVSAGLERERHTPLLAAPPAGPQLAICAPGQVKGVISAPSLLAESYRTTAASILLGHSACRVIVLASPEPMDGKSTVVSNLGIILASLGKRVLLLDGDLRKPSLHQIFGISNQPGLPDLLEQEREKMKPDALPVKTAAGPFVLPTRAGAIDVSVLYSPEMAALVTRFREEYDIVLVDTPAMQHISDARALARLADGVILVLRANSTERHVAQIVRQRFAEDGIPVLGTVLNDWNPRSSEHAYYDPKKFYYYYRD